MPGDKNTPSPVSGQVEGGNPPKDENVPNDSKKSLKRPHDRDGEDDDHGKITFCSFCGSFFSLIVICFLCTLGLTNQDCG
jgi:hypothetical protein